MRFTKIAITLLLAQLLLGCATAGDAKFNSSEKNVLYKSSINSMKIFIEVSVIGTVGRPETMGISIAQTHNDASQALVNAFKTKTVEAGITTTVKPFGSVTMVKDKTSTIVKSEQIGLENMIATASSSSEPLLVIQIYSSQAENNIWNGNLGWSLNLVDPTVWTIKNQTTIWKGTTDMTQFGPFSCSKDAYKSCADKLADSVIAQLRAEKLIK